MAARDGGVMAFNEDKRLEIAAAVEELACNYILDHGGDREDCVDIFNMLADQADEELPCDLEGETYNDCDGSATHECCGMNFCTTHHEEHILEYHPERGTRWTPTDTSQSSERSSDCFP